MARGLRRLGRLVGGAAQVEETASCARALTALVGRLPTVELLPGGASRATRALLTAQVLSMQDLVPWPAAIMRQFDPDDPAFLPPLDIHPVLAARDRTLLGLPDRSVDAWVDPYGWCGVHDGPAVTVWFGDAREGTLVGRNPDATAEPSTGLSQRRGERELGVLTRCRWRDLTLELRHWPVVLEGRVAFAIAATLTLSGSAPRPARLGFAIRPAGFEGAAPIFHLSRDTAGLWRADGEPLLAVARNGHEVLVGTHGQPDPWLGFCGRVEPSKLEPGPIDLRCPAGQATAVEVSRVTLTPGEPHVRLAVLVPPERAPAALARTTARTLWDGAQADRQGLLASGAEFELTEHQPLVLACRQRLLIDDGPMGLGGALGAVALARSGFVRRAGDRLSGWLSGVRRDGSLVSAEPEHGAVLAWAAAEYVRWTGARAWLSENLGAWRRLLDRLAREAPGPGGRGWFGRDGSDRWSAIWRSAALLSGAAALRDSTAEYQAWAMAGGRVREALPGLLGEGTWTATEGRAADGSAAGMLAACWLGLIPVDHPGAVATARHVRAHHWHGGGVLLRGGAHPPSTALVGAVLDRAEKEHPGRIGALGTVAALASPTGALPSARHPFRGALGEGDDRLGAALFLLLALDRVRADRRSLQVLPGIARARNLPTPFGPIDIVGGKVAGRWRGEVPVVEVFGA